MKKNRNFENDVSLYVLLMHYSTPLCVLKCFCASRDLVLTNGGKEIVMLSYRKKQN
jgi:hypothetical protein